MEPLMELALIPPLSRLADNEKQRWQLELPHMHIGNEAYAAHYAMLRGSHKKIILDNGAAEDEQLGDAMLFEVAYHLRPAEIALPDVLFDADGTVFRSIQFMKEFGSDLHSETAVGFVAQGGTTEEAVSTISTIMDSSIGGDIEVVYIPRLLVHSHGDRARLDAAEWVDINFPELDIHLFGASPNWYAEVREAAKLPYIRSIDTSLPYILAAYDTSLKATLREPRRRPRDYFDLKFNASQDALVDYNIETLKGWASGA
jgi:hypothetical protein